MFKLELNEEELRAIETSLDNAYQVCSCGCVYPEMTNSPKECDECSFVLTVDKLLQRIYELKDAVYIPKILPNGTQIKLKNDDSLYFIKGNDYETTDEFKNLNYYIGKENDDPNKWIMVLRDEFIIAS